MDRRGREWETLLLYDDIDKINERFIIAWLPVDDRKNAKDTLQIGDWNGKEWKLKSIGDKNSFFERETFKYSTVPLLCFIDSLKKPFGKVLSYSAKESEVKAFIDSGLSK